MRKRQVVSGGNCVFRNEVASGQAASSFVKSSPGVENSIQHPPGAVALFFQCSPTLPLTSPAVRSVGAAKVMGAAACVKQTVHAHTIGTTTADRKKEHNLY